MSHFFKNKLDQFRPIFRTSSNRCYKTIERSIYVVPPEGYFVLSLSTRAFCYTLGLQMLIQQASIVTSSSANAETPRAMDDLLLNTADYY